ncbi:MAG: 23S rRNA (pseudouridine(1915)-N(3))-methyltransferase RlmH [Tenericutes bacterium]|nr:23S rRNA (pseudouridine(1915)-N(3))-methyltransferase RlmH [Mycoplasmatota bacterium]MDY3801198.1 23S rRNA (pseudouridine(1915)-N(3))-methyltransferase RlmH [Bacilli bacterium]
MIKLITVGKIKEKYLKDAILEYTKRISKYTKLEIIELQDYDYDNKQIVLEKEKENIIKHINSRDYVITMQIEGKNISSEDFADKIDKVFVTNPNIVFIIGGSYGLHDDIKKISNFSLSFSKMTFPHQLFRVLLLEQIYRAYKIINNESYHK